VDIEQPHPIEQPAQPDGISATFKHTEQDILRFLNYSMWKVPRLRRGILRNILLGLIPILYGISVIYSLIGLEFPADIATAAILFPLWVKFYLGRDRNSTLKWTRETPYFYNQQTVTITPQGFELIFQGGESVMNWKEVYEIRDSGEQVLFYLTPKKAAFVPYSAFINETEARRFVDQAQAWWREARSESSNQ
jgi:hypothetical protein